MWHGITQNTYSLIPKKQILDVEQVQNDMSIHINNWGVHTYVYFSITNMKMYKDINQNITFLQESKWQQRKRAKHLLKVGS